MIPWDYLVLISWFTYIFFFAQDFFVHFYCNLNAKNQVLTM